MTDYKNSMSISILTLENELNKSYDVVCFEDLANIATSHGEIFRLFKKYHVREFSPKQKLVFYSSRKIPQFVLDHLQFAASKTDISNFFILVCGPIEIAEKLIIANQRHGYNDSVIEYLCVDLEPTDEFNNIGIHQQTTMCSLPFGTISASSDTFSVCCKTTQFIPNNENRNFSNIFQDPRIIKIQQHIKQGQRAPECQTCWSVEDLGSTSLRHHANAKFGDVCDTDWIDNPKIRSVDLNISSLCNFKCRICNPRPSSQWAVEELQYESSGEKIIELQSMIKKNSRDTLQHHLESLIKIAPELEHLHIMGGEPFMLPILDDLISQLVISGHSHHIRLEFNTNGSVWPEKVISQLNHFNKAEILMSIDNTGSQFELERGGSWPEVEANIRRFADLRCEHITVKLAPTVNVQNLLYLENLTAFAKELNLDIVWWYLEDPSYLSIDHVTQQVKDMVYKKYQLHPVEELCKIAERMHKTSAVSGQQFLKRMLELDQRRGETFSNTHREIFTAMGGVL